MLLRKRIIVTLLAILVILGMMPVIALAEDGIPGLPGHAPSGNQDPDDSTGGKDPIPTVITIDYKADLHVYEDIYCKIILKDANGNPLAGKYVNFTDNDREGICITDENGSYYIEDIYYTYGEKTITATFSGDSLYAGSTASVTINVQRLETALTLQTDKKECTVGEDVTISGRLYLTDPDDYPSSLGKTYNGNIKGQTVSLFINNVKVDVVTDGDGIVGTEDDDEEGFRYIFKPAEDKDYTVRAEFNQDDVYKGCTSETITFNAKKINTSLGIETEFNKGTLAIKAQRTASATGDVNVFVNGEQHVIKDTGTGELSLELKNILPGNYEIKASYSGDAAHTAAESQSTTVSIPKWYWVSFNANDDTLAHKTTGEMEDQFRTVGDGQPLYPCIYKFEPGVHYDFTGWNINAVGSGDAFSDQDTQDITQEGGTFVTLYAVWNNPQITTNRLPIGYEEKEYSFNLTATGLSDLEWVIPKGELPEGLSLDSGTGVISGIPKKSGKYNIKLTSRGTNSYGDMQELMKELTLTIAHVLTKTEAVEPTCTENGNSAYWTCSACGEFFADENGETKIEKDSWIIDATGHGYGAWEKLDEEKHQRICSRDGAHFEVEEHKWDDGVTSTKGLAVVTQYTCTICKATKEDVIRLIEYKAISGQCGEWTKGSAGTMNFVFERSENDEETFGLFLGIMVDGENVDETLYDAEAGSVIVRLKPEYLEKLSEGHHVLVALFRDGGELGVDFTINGAQASGDTPGGDKPGGDAAGGDTPGGDSTGGDTSGEDTPSGDTPSENPGSGEDPSPSGAPGSGNNNSDAGESQGTGDAQGTSNSQSTTNTTGKSPSTNTGDQNNITLWIILLITAALGTLVLFIGDGSTCKK